MTWRMFFIFLALATVLIFSCAPKPKVAIPITGSPLTPEWKEYNIQAEVKNAPKLVYLATCKRLEGAKGKKKPKEITDNFSVKDERFYVFSRWRNVFGKPTYAIKIYDPRGVLFYDWECAFHYRGPGWYLYTYLPIKNAPASRLPGKWRADIFMDRVLAARKEFVIGSKDVQYEQVSMGKEVPAIGVFRFIPRGRKGKNFKWHLPNFIARMLTIDFQNYRVILPRTLSKEMRLPTGGLEDAINDLVKSEIFNDVFTKHNIRVFIAGSVYDEGYVGGDIIVKMLIVDTKSKSITKKLSLSWRCIHKYDSVISLSTDLSNDVYKHLIKKAKEDIDIILKRG